MSGEGMRKLFNRNNLTTALELTGAALVVAGLVLSFGVAVGFIAAGLAAIGVGFLEGRKR